MRSKTMTAQEAAHNWFTLPPHYRHMAALAERFAAFAASQNAALAAEVGLLERLRASDATAILALHEAAGSNKVLSSHDLIAYWALVRDAKIAALTAEIARLRAEGAKALQAAEDKARATADDLLRCGRNQQAVGAQVTAAALRQMQEADHA
ncbi:hypothetical protein ACM64Y_00465 [Novispirillum sp. DQ9]|uniref:hypothetical protein n=1 Tax=Novispirillum sp. DQ9 TaxID=3398612 RepID=UPI003C7D9D09